MWDAPRKPRIRRLRYIACNENRLTLTAHDAIAATPKALTIATGSHQPPAQSGQSLVAAGAFTASVSASGCPKITWSSRADAMTIRIAANSGAAIARTMLADIAFTPIAGPFAGVRLLLASQAVTAPAPAPAAQAR